MIQEFLRWLARWRGIELEPGAELRFELQSLPTGGLGLLLLLLGVGALVLVLSVYRRDAGGLTAGRRLLLASLRVIAVLSALLLVLEPTLVAVKRDVRPGHTILLLDVSQSMNHKDAFRREAVQDRAAGWRALGVADPANASRLDLAKALLGSEQQKLMQELGRKNRVLAYGFAATSEPLPAIPAPAPKDGEAAVPQLDLARFAAEGRHSNLGGAVRAALEKSRDAAVAGLIVLSDGRRNMGPQGPEVARLLGQRKVPHTLVLPIGDPSETQSLEVTRIDAPEKVFQKDPFRVRGHVAAQGYEQVTVAVRLLEVGESGSARLVQSKQVPLGGKVQDLLVEFDELNAETPGLKTYRVEVEPPSGEAVVPERHHKHAQVEVLTEQIRVLLLAGGPSFEYRVLTNLLVRDKTVNVSCWLQSADPDFPQDGDTPIKQLPQERKDLAVYDAFVLLDPDAGKLTKEFCELVAKLVQDDGAGLWWICGEKFTLEALRDTASTKVLADVLPVFPDIKLADTDVVGLGKAFGIAWPFVLTPEGEAHQATRLLTLGKDENKLLWPRIPGHHFAFPVLKPKPTAQVLLAHSSPKLRRADGPMPLYATHFLGAGRVLFTGFDETYRWRSRFEDAYNKFWVKGLRYLFEGRLAAGNSRFRIRLSADKSELGEPLRISVEAQDEGFKPLVAPSVAVLLRKDGGAQETIEVPAVAEAPGRFERVWQPPSAGFYRFAPGIKAGKDVEAALQVVPAAIEKEGPVDLAELGAIAQTPGGKLCTTPQELLEAVGRIPSLTATDVFRTPHPIWDSWATVA